VPFPPLTSVLAVSWAHPGFSEQQATSQTTPANSQGVTLGDVVPAVCCVFGVIPNAKTQRFGIWGAAPPAITQSLKFAVFAYA
jgi:hypothetical protein